MALSVRSLFLFVFILAFTGRLPAQTFYGSIVGTVTDATEGLLPGAHAILFNLGTSSRRTAETNSAGQYEFVNLIPGMYRLDLEKNGFKHFTRNEIQVEVGGVIRVDALMQVGEMSQVVEVASQTPLLQTDTSSLSQVVESQVVQEMPLNGRNVFNLAALVPGVVAQGGAMSNPGVTGVSSNAYGDYQIGGGMANQSAFYLDGAPLNINYVNMVALVPTQDSIQEFRVQTNSLGAEFGRSGGGVVNLTTRSGTNDFHGTAYEFLRNKVLNANTFFNNSSGVGTPAFTQNQFGTNLSGPVIKQKTFFFFSYEGFRLRQGTSTLTSVPTAAMRGGDFSNLRTNKGALIPVYDPLTTCGLSGTVACPAGQTGNRQPFPNNIIPTSRFDPTASAMLRLWGLPNLAGQQFTNVDNFAANVSTGGDNDQYNGRVDQNISDKQRLFGRYTHWSNNLLPSDPFGTKTGKVVAFTTQQEVLADTYTFNATTVGDLRLAFLRFVYGGTPQSLGVDLSQFGPAYAALNDQVAFRVNPLPCVQGFTNFCTETTNVAHDNSYSLAPSLTKIAGRHTIKAGLELRRLDFNYAQSNQPAGVFNFDNLFTSVNPFAPAGTGEGFASFLLGYGTTNPVGNPNGIVTPALTAGRNFYQGYYVSDSFQVNSKLTLNLGVRWDIPGPWTEGHDSLTVWLPNAVNPLAQPTGLPLLGKLGLVNSPDRSARGDTDEHFRLFAPRVGFAYRLTSKTVIRGGYGILYLPSDINFAMSPYASPVNSISTTWTPTLDGGVTPYQTLSNPFPNGVLQPPGHNPSFQSLLLGQSVASPIPSGPYPYVQQWNFTVQRELASGMALEVAYAGSKGVHLLGYTQQADQLPDQDLALGSALQEQVANPFYGLISSGTLAAATVARGQLLRPFPEYNGVSIDGPDNRNSSYDSLQVKMEKRVHGGGQVLASYTWSKLISDTDTLTSWLESGGVPGFQDNNNIRLERSIATNDVPQHLVISYAQELPVGKGKALFGNVSRLTGKIVSGWGVDGVSTFQTGYPLGLTTSVNLTNSFGGGSRPNVVAGCAASLSGSAQSRLTQWFNTSCFTQPPASTFGTAGRLLSGLRATGINNWDMSVYKNTQLTERVSLRFRVEFFNLSNRVQFGFPNTVLGTPQFGIVSAQANNPRLIQFALQLRF